MPGEAAPGPLVGSRSFGFCTVVAGGPGTRMARGVSLRRAAFPFPPYDRHGCDAGPGRNRPKSAPKLPNHRRSSSPESDRPALSLVLDSRTGIVEPQSPSSELELSDVRVGT